MTQRPDRPRCHLGATALIAVAVALVGACGSQSVSSTDTANPYVGDGPYIGADPDHLLDSVTWIDPLGDSYAGLVDDIDEWAGGNAVLLLADSQPSVLVVAVSGGGCLPGVVVSAQGPPEAVHLSIELAHQPLSDPTAECAAILRSHAFQVALREPTEVAEVTLSLSKLR